LAGEAVRKAAATWWCRSCGRRSCGRLCLSCCWWWCGGAVAGDGVAVAGV